MSWQNTFGATLFSTVTVAVHVDTFPFTSVTVSVTVFAPSSAQVNVLGSTTIEAIAQLSELPPSTSVAVIEAFPVASSWIVISWQIAIGSTLSSTVTTASQVDELPFTSVTVRVIVFGPTSAQTNASWEIARLSTAQLSKLPPSTSAATIDTFPVASNWTVISWQTGVGAILSSTVTSAVHVETFP